MSDYLKQELESIICEECKDDNTHKIRVLLINDYFKGAIAKIDFDRGNKPGTVYYINVFGDIKMHRFGPVYPVAREDILKDPDIAERYRQIKARIEERLPITGF